MRTAPALLLLVSAYLVLCAVYTVQTPYRQAGTLLHQAGLSVPDIGAPDERQHANYVQHLLDGKGFPVLKPGSPELGETYQSHQPPLYYLLAAGWAKLTAAEPTSPETGGRVRYLNLLIGALTLLGVFMAAKWGLGREDVALAAVAFTGLMPMFVALHAAVSNDPLLFLTCTWTLALCAKGVRFGWDWRTAVLCGVCAGLGLLTKTTALALLPTLLVALIASRVWSPARPPIGTWAAVLLIPVLVSLPWMLRNHGLYGDPLAISAFNAAFKGSPSASAFVAVYGGYAYWVDWVGWWTARSFVGVFGYMDLFFLDSRDPVPSATAYRLVLAFLAAPAVAWFASLRSGLDGPSRAMTVTNAVLLAVVVALFVRFNMQYFQGQARYLYPAIGPISVGLGSGLCHLLGRHKQWSWLVAAGFLACVQVLALMTLSGGFGPR
jgi:4-amino-4-deoxy-L-arabinose transferase-like glycosyltransferase